MRLRYRLLHPSRFLHRLFWGIVCLTALWWLYPPLFLVEVQGASMCPTYASGQLLVATPVGHVQRGDVVVAHTSVGTVIKRVAYVGGAKVSARATNATYTNPYEMFAQPGRLGQRWRSRVPKGTVYLTGDNFEHSDDSRDFGPVPIRDIQGRIIGKMFLPPL